MKRLLFLGLLCLTITSWATPTLGVANISMPSSTASMPNFINVTSDNSNDQAAAKILQQQMTNFSAQVRGQIIQSKYFQVVDIDDNLARYYLANSKNNESAESTLALTVTESNLTSATALKNNPDYILIGTIAAINAEEETNPITDTNKFSVIYTIDLAVDYKLIKTKTHAIVASFTAAGHAGDVKLTSKPNQKIVHNIPKLAKQVGDDLTKEVLNQLSLQLEGGKVVQDTPASPTKVTDVKVYD